MNPLTIQSSKKKTNSTLSRWLLLLILPTVLVGHQAYALSDDETAVLVGLAVGGVTALSVKHHLDHDRHNYRTQSYYKQRRHEHHYCDHRGRHYHDVPRHVYREPRHSEHYVIHRPPARHFDRRSDRDHHHQGDRHSVRF